MRITALIASLFIASACQADTDGSWGPAVGKPLPSSLEAADHQGQARHFDDLRGEQGLAIFFVRSADWCPYCKRQLIDVNRRLADFRQRGLGVVAVSYDDAKILADFAGEWDIAYPLLADEGSRIIRDFGILNRGERPGTKGYGIPHPGIVIADADGQVIASFAEVSYRKRPSIDSVLATIDEVR